MATNCTRCRLFGKVTAVGAYITASITKHLAGIRPHDATEFIATQLAVAFAAILLFNWLIPFHPFPPPPKTCSDAFTSAATCRRCALQHAYLVSLLLRLRQIIPLLSIHSLKNRP